MKIALSIALVLAGLFGCSPARQDRPADPLALPPAPLPESPAQSAELPPAPEDGRPFSPEGGLWFGDEPTAEGIGPAQARLLIRRGESLIRNDANPFALPPAIRDDRKVRFVFLSVGDGKSTARTGWGCQAGIDQALQAAGRSLRGRLDEGFEPRSLRMDIVSLSARQDGLTAAGAELFGIGRTGLAGPAGSRLALHPGETAAAGLDPLAPATAIHRILLRTQRDVRREAEVARIARQIGFAFMTKAWLLSEDKVWPLYRGHRQWSLPTDEQLLASAVEARDYLARSVEPGGRFLYEYDPVAHRAKQGYNLLRHAGTLFAMCQVQQVAPSDANREAIDRAAGYLVKQIHPAGDVAGAAWLVEDNEVKLGGNGLAILALAKHAEVTDSLKHLKTMQAMARWIAGTQEPSGRFRVHKYELVDGAPVVDDFRSEYYPGEAIFGLMRLYRLDGNDLWLDTADKSARYRIAEFSKLQPSELPHDHWLLYGLGELYRDHPRPLFLEFSQTLTDTIIDHQKRHHVWSDWQGAFRLPPASTQTATRCEGLAAAWKLMKQARRNAQADKIAEALALGLEQMMGMQMRIDSAMFLPDPARARGGFYERFEQPDIRIDTVQHSISALLGYRDLLANRHPRPHR